MYYYEVESYWDPVKKQSRQRRRYLGKKDPATGAAVTPRKGFTPRAVRDYGHVYLLRALAERAGLVAVLEAEFGAEEAELLLALGCHQVAEGRPLYLFGGWQEGNHLPLTEAYPSQRLSRYVAALGQRDRERERFFGRWIERLGTPEAVVFDITSLSSWARLVDLVEWGYNRDGEALPQVNLGLVFAQPVNLPIAYRVWPGSVADVATLGTTAEFLQAYGLRELAFVLDRGFYSAANVGRMAAAAIRFLLPVPFTAKWARTLVGRHRRALTSPARGFCFQKQTLGHVPAPVSVAETPLRAHLYFDRQRQAGEEAQLIRRLVQLETQAAEPRFKSRPALVRFVNRQWPGASRLFTLSVRDGRAVLERKPKAIARLVNRLGYTVMLTNRAELDRDEVLRLYRRRDDVERLFDVLKNEIREDRLRAHSRAAVEGRLFVCFLSLILYAALDNAMKAAGLYQNLTIAEVLAELKKLRVVEMTSGKTYLTEITKKQRTLFEKLNIPIPVSPRY